MRCLSPATCESYPRDRGGASVETRPQSFRWRALLRMRDVRGCHQKSSSSPPSPGAGSERERSEESKDAIWTWISRSGLRFGGAALQKQGQPGHDIAAQFLDSADAG